MYTMRFYKKESKLFKGYCVWVYGPKHIAFISIESVDKKFFMLDKKHGSPKMFDTLEDARIYLVKNAALYF